MDLKMPVLCSFSRLADESNSDSIIAWAPFEETFIIDDPYTAKYELSRKHEFKYEYLPRGLHDDIADNVIVKDTTWTFWHIPSLRGIRDRGDRLYKLMWIPYSRIFEEGLAKAQLEYYVCHQGQHATTHILLPLRVRDEEATYRFNTEFGRLEGFNMPTFSIPKGMYSKLQISMQTAPGIHFFWFYRRGDQDTSVPTTAIQFVNAPFFKAQAEAQV